MALFPDLHHGMPGSEFISFQRLWRSAPPAHYLFHLDLNYSYSGAVSIGVDNKAGNLKLIFGQYSDGVVQVQPCIHPFQLPADGTGWMMHTLKRPCVTWVGQRVVVQSTP